LNLAASALLVCIVSAPEADARTVPNAAFWHHAEPAF
jgi:hypothetical protein